MKKIGLFLGLLLALGLAFAIQPAEGWNAGAQGKYSSSANANVTTEGGNVTPLNLTGNVSTEKWAGYWGNVSGNIVLSPGTDMFYTWAWTSGDGEVCAIADSSGFDWSSVQAIAAATIDTIWGFVGADTDSATSTLTSACNLDVATSSVTGVGTTHTGSGNFETCAVGDGDDVAKQDVAFCVNISSAALFNGQTGDYELLAATDEALGATETHYFWVELD